MTPPTPDDINNYGPELSILAVLQAVLQATRSALFAAHPDLQLGPGLDQSLPPNPAVWLAEALIEQGAVLDLILDRYYAALRIPPSVAIHNLPNF